MYHAQALHLGCCSSPRSPSDVAYSDSKDLAKRTISYKNLKERSYEIAISHKYDGYQRGLTSMVYKFFDKKTESGANVNGLLAQKLQISKKGKSMPGLKTILG